MRPSESDKNPEPRPTSAVRKKGDYCGRVDVRLAAEAETLADVQSAFRSTIAFMANGGSIEVTPREALRGVKGLDSLSPGTRTFIAHISGGSFDDMLSAAANLRDRGLVPVPHITARTIPDARTLARRLDQLVARAGVQEILLVAGSNSKSEGEFTNAVDIIDSGVIESSGLRALSVAGHPEGHPQAEESELHRTLDAKNMFAARTGMPMTLVTQFFFDASPVIAWEKRIRVLGNKLPIDPGLHGVTGIPSLMKYALACGVGASAKVLAQRSGKLLQLAQTHSPDELLSDIAMAKTAEPKSLFRYVHLFPLGGFERTVAWAENLRRGRFSVTPAGRLAISE